MEARGDLGWDRASAKALRTLSLCLCLYLHLATLCFLWGWGLGPLCNTRILSQVPDPHPQVTQQAGLADQALCSPIQATEARLWGRWTGGVCEQQGGHLGGRAGSWAPPRTLIPQTYSLPPISTSICQSSADSRIHHCRNTLQGLQLNHP